jgi:hypothetical protein
MLTINGTLSYHTLLLYAKTKIEVSLKLPKSSQNIWVTLRIGSIQMVQQYVNQKLCLSQNICYLVSLEIFSIAHYNNFYGVSSP